jgi:hypothetical protein
MNTLPFNLHHAVYMFLETYGKYSTTLLFSGVCSYYPDIIMIAVILLPSYGGNERKSDLQFQVPCSGQHLFGWYRKMLPPNHNYCALSTV